jgi:glycosyltransferase involved in cell wall biosynthesis
MNIRIRKAIKRSELIYFVTSDDGQRFSKKSKRAENLLDMGAYLVTHSIKERLLESPVKVIWVGRFSFLKALDLLLKATSSSDILKGKMEIIIIGDGPQIDYYQKIAADLELTNIKWMGHISKEQVFEIMLDSDLLVHTSIKEAASAVILESLSAGLPVVCHDAFGMHFAINEKCGRKIPFISQQKSIDGFKQALERLCLEPLLLNELKSGAVERAKELSWDSIAKKIALDYNNVLSKINLRMTN